MKTFDSAEKSRFAAKTCSKWSPWESRTEPIVQSEEAKGTTSLSGSVGQQGFQENQPPCYIHMLSDFSGLIHARSDVNIFCVINGLLWFGWQHP